MEETLGWNAFNVLSSRLMWAVLRHLSQF
jgi:hypothetical protein